MKNSFSHFSFSSKISIFILIGLFTFCNYAISQKVVPVDDIHKADPSQVTLVNYVQSSNFFDIQKNMDEYFKNKPRGKGDGWKAYKRWEYFWGSRTDKNGELQNPVKTYKEVQNYNEQRTKKNRPQANPEWTFMGPSKMPNMPVNTTPSGLGRINCLAFDPNNSLTMWAGASFGGVWRTSDGGLTWKTFPFTEFQSIGISDIAVDPKTPNDVKLLSPPSATIVYAATGDADGSLGGNACFSIGVVKTTDAGKTWKLTGLNAAISERFTITRLLVHPRSADTVYAATTRGLYKTTDGGENWVQFLQGYFRDIEFKPDDPSILYAACLYNNNGTFYGMLKFKIIDAAPGYQVMAGFGYPVDEIRRVAIAVNPNFPNYIYMVFAAADGGLYNAVCSENAGTDWYYLARRELQGDLLNAAWDLTKIDSKSQGFYDLCIAASPVTPDSVYIGGVNIWKISRKGNGHTCAGYWQEGHMAEGAPFIHADHHALEFRKDNVLFSANDGGVSYFKQGDKYFHDVSAGLEVTQFYRISNARQNAGIVVGGTQDNGTHKLSGGVWNNIRGGDGMDCLIDYYNEGLIYTSLYYGEFTKSTDGGGSFVPMIDTVVTGEKALWVTPIAIHPTNPRILYAGYQNVWESFEQGNYGSWHKISNFPDNDALRVLKVCDTDPKVIYCVNNGGIYVTFDGGKQWTRVVTGGGISDIAIDPRDPRRFWLTIMGFGEQKVLEYTGSKLIDITGSLPNVPINCILYQNESEDRLYLGTDVGVFLRDKNMNDWEPFNNNLPNVVVMDLDIHYGSGKLRAGTFGRGLWETKIIVCNLNPPTVNITGNTKFCKGDSVKLEVSGNYNSYRWSTGDTTKSIIVKSSDKITVAVTDSMGCSATSNVIDIEVFNIPNIIIQALTPNPFCEGDSVQLRTSFGFQSILWSNGMTERTITVKSPGILTVTGTTSDGCKNTSTPFEVKMYDAPKPSITRNGDSLYSSSALSYKWYYNGQVIFQANKQACPIKGEGNYEVEVQYENACQRKSDIFVVGTSVEEDIQNGYYVNLNPNPTPGLFTLETYTESQKNIEIYITNLIGIRLINLTESNFAGLYRKQIDLQNFTPGIYFVNVRIGANLVVRKIIKE